MDRAPGLIVSFQDAMSDVMSLSAPASACAAMIPPPHDWNRSGMSPAWIDVASLVLKASFSRTVTLILTFGCAAVYASAIAWKSDLPGSPVVMCHQSTVTGAPPPAVEGASLVPTLGASLAAVEAAVVGAVVAAVVGAVVAVVPPQAAATMEIMATAPANRQRVLTMGTSSCTWYTRGAPAMASKVSVRGPPCFGAL